MEYFNAIKVSLIFIFIVSNVPALAQSDSVNCAFFKLGNFVYRNDSNEVVLIKRTARIQEEYNQTKDIKTRFKIKWVSACSYQIKQVWSNSKMQRKHYGNKTIISISAATKDQYEFTCTCKGNDDITAYEGKVYKLP